MKHKEMWTEIAGAFLTPESEGTYKQGDMASMGLCWAFWDSTHALNFSAIRDFLVELRPNADSVYWFCRRGQLGHRRGHDLIRGDMATLFACMTEKEFNQLLAPQVPT